MRVVFMGTPDFAVQTLKKLVEDKWNVVAVYTQPDKPKNRGMKLNPSLYVLKHATMPAVLLEMGFISNSEDAALLCEQPELFVQGIYDGILNYFEHIYILKVCTLIGLIGVVSVIFFIAGFVLMKKYNLKQTRTSVENMDGDDSAQESERIS